MIPHCRWGRLLSENDNARDWRLSTEDIRLLRQEFTSFLLVPRNDNPGLHICQVELSSLQIVSALANTSVAVVCGDFAGESESEIVWLGGSAPRNTQTH